MLYKIQCILLYRCSCIVPVETGAEIDEIDKSEECSDVNALYLECKCHVGLYRSITSVPTAIHVLSGG